MNTIDGTVAGQPFQSSCTKLFQREALIQRQCEPRIETRTSYQNQDPPVAHTCPLPRVNMDVPLARADTANHAFILTASTQINATDTLAATPTFTEAFSQKYIASALVCRIRRSRHIVI